MAHSPENSASTSDIIRYDLGWNAINAMLRAGRSLSGHERNCCFLNSRSDRFADVSSVVGLDLIDDGRVLAFADWDYDGDTDFWIANRSGPSVRHLENQLADGQTFFAIRLEGVNCNRDAIGARVKVTAEINGETVHQSQTLKAGEGYLAQNSKWLRFGLGKTETVDQLTIRWPNGQQQEFNALPANSWYVVRERDETPQSWQPPSFPQLVANKFEEPAGSDAARILLLNPLPMPAIQAAVDGADRDITEPTGSKRLVTLWATWCQPCLKELAEWKSHQNQFDEAGLKVIAVNVDEASEDRQRKVDATLKALKLPFETIDGSQQLVEQFDVLQRSLLSRQRAIPIPSSFLIDEQGRLQCLYKGPVSSKQILQDVNVSTATREERLQAAIPFTGRWLAPPGGSTPLLLAVKYLEGGLKEQAKAYIESLVQLHASHPEYVTSAIMNLYGATMLDEGRLVEAADSFTKSLSLNPNDRQAHIELGTIRLRQREGALATQHFESVLKTSPNDPELLYKFGFALLQAGKVDAARDTLTKSVNLNASANAYWQLGNANTQLQQTQAAIDAYSQAIQLEPTLVYSANNLAWLLATSQDARARDGVRAVEIAEQMSKRAPNDASAKDTLAAAYAEIGSFDKAISTAELAKELATSTGNQAMAERIEARIQLYRNQLPFRESF